MNGGKRGPRHAAALAVGSAVAVLAACGGSPPGAPSLGASASAGSATYRADPAYARCMQTHGVPDFPDPSPAGSFGFSGQPRGNGPAAQANRACEHLLPTGLIAPATAGRLPDRVGVLRPAPVSCGLRHPAAAGSRDRRPRRHGGAA